jgi:hypothetical protein
MQIDVGALVATASTIRNGRAAWNRTIRVGVAATITKTATVTQKTFGGGLGL